jgi:iron complex outermembrane receptor protein
MNTIHVSLSRRLRAAVHVSLAACAIPATGAAADEDRTSAGGTVLEEIVVTARQREESLQDVPDSITAFTAAAIENAGISEINDFMNMTPNLFYKQGFRAGSLGITMRGISTGQNGWAPVTFVVDGVPTATVEGFNQGTLFDVERIEVLKGPQSAVYGAGAIAGAINIITREPTSEFDASTQLVAAEGSDYRANVAVSGPVGGALRYRLAGSFRDSDGVMEDGDGDPIAGERHRALRGRLLGEFGNFRFDAQGFWADSNPDAYNAQTALPTTDPAEVQRLLDDFDILPARGIIGREQRDIREASLKLGWQTGIGEFALLGGYSKIDQHGRASASFLKPPFPFTFCGPVGGAGEPADCLQDNQDDVESKSADVRLTSASDQRIRWLVGAAWMERETLNSFYLDDVFAGPDGGFVENPPPVFGSTHFRNDEFIGAYGQVNIDITPAMELTLAGRWDRNQYDSTQYADRSLGTPVPQPDGTVTQEAEDSEFQPKAQLSYDWTDDVMTYVTVARGFRTGYFNSGVKTEAETTTNYEIGLKALALDGQLQINTSLYHIDYSEQQFSFITPTPPFRGSTNIPKTSIDGGELEISAVTPIGLSANVGLGITDARVDDGTESPSTPKFTLNLGAEYERPIGDDMSWSARVDYRRQGSYYLQTGNTFNVEPKDFLNLRMTLRIGEHWTASVFGENVLDAQQAIQASIFPWYTVRQDTFPGTYGIEIRYDL